MVVRGAAAAAAAAMPAHSYGSIGIVSITYSQGAGVGALERQFRRRRRQRRRRQSGVVVMRHHEEVILPYQGSTQATSYVVLCYSIVCQACLEEGKCTPTAADIADAAMLPPPVALWTPLRRRNYQLRRPLPRSVNSSYCSNYGNLTSFLVALYHRAQVAPKI